MKHKRVKTHRMSPERDHATISRMSDRSTCHPPDHAHSSAAHPQCMDSSVVERLVYTVKRVICPILPHLFSLCLSFVEARKRAIPMDLN